MCGARGSHKLYGSPTPLCPTHPGYRLGRAEGQMLEKCIPRTEAAEQSQDLCPFEWIKCTGLRGESLRTPKQLSTEIGRKKADGQACPARLLRQGPRTAAFRPSPEQHHYTRGSAQVPSERKTEVGFCLTWSHGVISWDKGLTLREHAEKAGAGPLTIPLFQP